MDFVIDRTKWRCGGHRYTPQHTEARGLGDTLLLNGEGYMCCLGHVALQCGLASRAILNLGNYDDFMSSTWYDAEFEQLSGALVGDATDDDARRRALNDFQMKAISINDDRSLSDSEREEALIELFASRGHSIRFDGEYVQPTSQSDEQ